MIGFNYTPPRCPEHPDERLDTTTICAKIKDSPGIIIPLIGYCPQSKKYLSVKGKLVSKQEAALEFFKKQHNKDYRLSDIELI